MAVDFKAHFVQGKNHCHNHLPLCEGRENERALQAGTEVLG